MATNTGKGFRKGPVKDRYAQQTARGDFKIKDASNNKTIRRQTTPPKGITKLKNPRAPK